MAKKPSITTISSGYASTTALNDNFEALKEAFENTLSRDGSTPNTMGADLDMNGNDIVGAGSILVGGVDYLAQSLAYKNAAETAKTAAEAAKVAAELAYDNFDDRYLGAKTSDPSTDNDGNALLDGALYFDTTLNVMKVYDSGNTLWKRTTPTTSEQANIDTVSGISSDVTTVAGISTNVTTVADNITDVNSVATNMAEVLTADTNAATATTKAAEASASATAAANSATSASTSATTASNQATAAATSASNAATSESNASTSAANAATSATSASGSASTATTQASNAASSASAASTSETNSANSAAASATSASNAATSESNAATSASNASTSASNAATSASNASTSASDAATSATAAAASYDSFDDRYLGVKTTAPTTDNDGDALTTGCLYYNSTIGQLYIWDGSAWDDAALSASGAVTAFNTRTGSVTLNSTDVSNASGLLTTGGTMTGNLSFGDNNKAIFGAGSDLQIYHDGSNSYISEVGDGDLYVRGSNFYITKPNGSLYFSGSNSTGEAGVYFNNSKKLATTATGIDVTGTVTADGLTVDGISTFTSNVFISHNVTPLLRLEDTDTALDFDLLTAGSNATIRTKNGAYPLILQTNELNRVHVSGGGDISFYEDTGTTAKFFWDASAESLNIRTTSSGSAFELNGNGRVLAGNFLQFNRTDNATGAKISNGGAGNGLIFNELNSEGFKFQNNGSDKVVIDSSGNVGIGTSSPNFNLHIHRSDYAVTQYTAGSYGTASTDGLLVGFNSSGEAFLNQKENSHMRFSTNNTERMRIDSSGNVGIGTSSPATTVEINGDTGLTVHPTSASTTGVIEIAGTRSSGASAVAVTKIKAIPENPAGNSDAASLAFETRSSSGTVAERMRIDSSGNVTIKAPTTSGGGILNLENTTTSVNGQDWGSVNFISNDSSTNASGTRASIVGTSTSFNGDGNLVFSTAPSNGSNTERMRIDSSGNLLVGTTDSTPIGSGGTAITSDGRIDISRNGGLAAQFERRTSDGNVVAFIKDGSTVGSIGAKNGVVLIGSGATGLMFESGGNDIIPRNTDGSNSNGSTDLGSGTSRFKDAHFSGTVNAANFNTTSDATLKTNVETLTGSLDAVKALRGVSFDWIESGNSEVGVIAQEVEAVVPDVVSTDDQGIKSVKYGNLVGVLIEAIKEQQAQIDELKAKLGD